MLDKCKYLCCLIFVLFSFSKLNGQTTDTLISPGKILPGTWQWTNCRDTFTIQLFRIDTAWKSNFNNDVFGPKIYGWHRYVENGILVETSFPDSLPQAPFSKGIFGGIRNNKECLIMFHDITRGRDFWIDINFLDSSGTRMKWVTYRPQERVLYPPPKPKIWSGQTIPSPIILHKISD